MSDQTYNAQDPSDQTEQMTQAQDQTGNLGGGSDFNGIGENGSTDLGNNTTISGGSGLGGDTSGSAAGATGAASGSDMQSGSDYQQSQSGTQSGSGHQSGSDSESNNSEPTGGKWGLSHEQPERQPSDDQSRPAVGGTWDGETRTGEHGIDDDSVQFDADMGDGRNGSSTGGSSI